jgi:hypothetical protein
VQLVPERIDHARRRTHEYEPSRLNGSGKFRSFGEKPVTRVDRIGARLERRREDRVDPKVALGWWWRSDPDGHVGQPDVLGRGIGVAVDRDGFHSGLMARPDDSNGDLAAIGDQDAPEGGACHRSVGAPR